MAWVEALASSAGRQLLAGGPALPYVVGNETRIPVYGGFYEILDEREGEVCGPRSSCYCEGWGHSHGTITEFNGFRAVSWIVFAMTILLLLFYGYEAWKATCGWEEVYVSIIELAHVSLEIYHELSSPATLYLSTGNLVLWLRYAEWLLSCPVILIHMGNLTGLKNDYSKRTMGLLISDIGTIVFGTTAAMSTGYLKVVFFLCGLSYGAMTFFLAAKVYIESYHSVPKGQCRMIVRGLAWLYFGSWAMFPILFVLGPEGFGHITAYGSGLAHGILDITSKNMWGLLAHLLRVKIHEHILIHGNLTKKTKINIAGDELEVEEMVDAEEEGAEDKGTSQLANRQSFLIMRDRLKAKGVEVRASLDATSVEAEKGGMGMGGATTVTNNMMAYGGMGGGMGMGGMGMGGGFGGMGGGFGGMGGAGFSGMMPGAGAGGANVDAMGFVSMAPPVEPSLESGRVLLVVADPSLVEFWRQQFSSLSAPFEVAVALGVDQAVQIAQQALSVGGPTFIDFVLLAPELIQAAPRGPAGAVGRLKSLGLRVCAYGWQPQGPVRELVEGSGVDGYLMGPIAPMGINRGQLVQLIARMQAMKRGGAGAAAAAAATPSARTSFNIATPPNALGRASATSMAGAVAANPLFNSPPSPMASNTMLPTLPAAPGFSTPTAAPGGGAPAGSDAEAAMMMQLMSEINALKQELGH